MTMLLDHKVEKKKFFLKNYILPEFNGTEITTLRASYYSAYL
jgi:hypothetical protein